MQKFLEPTVEVIKISTIDVITASGDITVSDEGKDKWTNGYY